MGNIYFRIKGRQYKIYFYPCGYMARVENVKTKLSRDIKYDKTTSVLRLAKNLPKILDF